MNDLLIFDTVQIERTASPDTAWVPSGVVPIEPGFDSFTIPRGTDGAQCEVLGAGNTFGPVVGATLAGGDQVAVKLFLPLKPEFDRELLYEYAVHEFRRASENLGPGFMRAYTLVETEDREGRAVFALVMERIWGPSLDVATRGTDVPHETQLRFTQQMLDALAVLADRTILWKDIKPSNIRLDHHDLQRANLVFIDHGAATNLDAGTHVNGQFTFGFAAPETLVLPPGAKARVFTHATDLFSAGVTLLSAFTRGRPYGDDNSEYRTLHSRPNLDSPLLNDHVRTVLACMLVRNPNERPTLPVVWSVLDDDPPLNFHPDPWRPYDHPIPPAMMSTTDVAPDHTFVSIATHGTEPSIPEASAPDGPATREVAADAPADLIPLLPESKVPASHSGLLEFAGVDSAWVRDPNERKMYGAIGIALMLYFVYICLGSAAVAWQATESIPAALAGFLVIGPLVGVVLVNFDRTIVATHSPNLKNLEDGDTPNPIKKTWGFWLGMVVRVFIALVAAFIIGEALNVQIHAGDVTKQLAEERRSTIAQADGKIDVDNAQAIAALKSAVSTAEQARDEVRDAGDGYLNLAKQESAGEGATRRPTCGPKCQEYQRLEGAARQRWQVEQDQLNTAVTNAKTAVTNKENEIVALKAEAEKKITAEVAGPLARSHALIRKAMTDPLMAAKYIGLIILFIAIELTAIIIKLLTMGSGYERDMARRRRRQEYTAQKEADVDHFHVRTAAEMNKKLTQDLIWLQSAERAAAIDRRAQRLAQDLGIETPPGAIASSDDYIHTLRTAWDRSFVKETPNKS